VDKQLGEFDHYVTSELTFRHLNTVHHDQFGLTSKIIMCFLRHLDEESAFEILDQALVHKDKIVGVGLDSSEVGHPPRKFERIFKKAIKNDSRLLKL